MRFSSIAFVSTAFIALLLTFLSATSVHSNEIDLVEHGYNDEQLDWMSYDSGIAIAQETGKPIFMLAVASWCPVCNAYKEEFNAPEVVSSLQDFVLILVDVDENPEIAEQFEPDGKYVPRTMILNKDGELLPHIKPQKGGAYNYFLKFEKPGSLLQFLIYAKYNL